MDKKVFSIIFFSIFIGAVNAEQSDIQKIVTLIDAYEEQAGDIKVEYVYKFPLEEEGQFDIIKGSFAQKRSHGYMLLDEKRQKGKDWDKNKEIGGIVRSYNGEVTRYLEHEKNDHGYHMAALYENHNPKLYKTSENPFYRFYRVNYNTKISDILSNPAHNVELHGKENIDGHEALKISIEKKDGSSKRQIWLLPDKNYLPVRYRLPIEFEGKEIYWQIEWDDFRKSDEGIWFPWRIETKFSDVSNPSVFQVESADFSPLTKEDFEFNFPDFTHVTDHLLGTKYLTTQTIEMSGLEDVQLAESSLSNKQKEKILDNYVEKKVSLKELPEEQLEVSEAVSKQEETTNFEKESSSILWIIIAAVFFSVGSALFARRRKA